VEPAAETVAQRRDGERDGGRAAGDFDIEREWDGAAAHLYQPGYDHAVARWAEPVDTLGNEGAMRHRIAHAQASPRMTAVEPDGQRQVHAGTALPHLAVG